MKTRFPLYLKILLWFFLNLVFLVAVFAVLAQAQFQFGWSSLIAGPAGQHVQDVARLLAGELANDPRTDWDGLLKEYGGEYHVKFYLFHTAPGQLEQLAGETVDLPAEVRHRMQSRPGMNPPPRGNGSDRLPEPGDDQNYNDAFPPREGGPPPQRAGPPPRFMLHESGRYWVVMPVPAEPFGRGPGGASPPHIPLPASVVISSATLGAGGLFFNPTPWILAALAVVVVSALFWIPLVRGITRSLSRMTEATERIAEGRFDVRTRMRRRDELGTLSGAIDQMAGRLSGLVGGQKRFLGDIAHELCSPIARIQVALGILEQRADESQKARVDDLREEVEQMSSLVNELLSFSRASLGKASVKLQPVPLRPIAEKAVARECGPDSGAKVIIDMSEDLTALAEPELLLRALANVLRNAVRYAASAGPIHISATRTGTMISLQVEDSGPGVPESALPQLFDPFYRVDSSRTRDTGGAGLGLSIVKTCIESCGGTVGCENLEPSGLRVIIRLPAAQ
jgi:two-component system, OmpR family, sensor histidine kinase CpxA